MTSEPVIKPSSVSGIELIAPGDADFLRVLQVLLGREPDDMLRAALPFSVIARNTHQRPVALLGIRFDMLSGRAKPYSVVHYADTLRNPKNAALTSGATRFVCAEPAYTEVVLRRLANVDPRGPMNLTKLRQAIQMRVSVDCVAFADGEFAGPDSQGAFERLANEREAEARLIEDVLRGKWEIDSAMELSGTRALVRKLSAAHEIGGLAEAQAQAQAYRLRIALRRA